MEYFPQKFSRRKLLKWAGVGLVVGSRIEVIEEFALVDLNGVGFPLKGLAVVAANGGLTGKAVEQLGKILGPGVGEIALGFRKVQGQIMSQNAVLGLDFPQGNMKIGLR